MGQSSSSLADEGTNSPPSTRRRLRLRGSSQNSLQENTSSESNNDHYVHRRNLAQRLLNLRTRASSRERTQQDVSHSDIEPAVGTPTNNVDDTLDDEPPSLVSAMNEPYPLSSNNVTPLDHNRHERDNGPWEEDEDFYRHGGASNSSMISDIGLEDMDIPTHSAYSGFAPGLDDNFLPQPSRHFEWMGRSIEALLLGHAHSAAPILALHNDEDSFMLDFSPESDFFARRRSTASTFGGGRRRSSHGSSFHYSGRRGSLSLYTHGGTLASYNRRASPSHHSTEVVDRSERMGRRGSTSYHAPVYRRRGSMASVVPATEQDSSRSSATPPTGAAGGPNVLLHLVARENTGLSPFARGTPMSQSLRRMGGSSLYKAFDKPAAGIASEVSFLAAAIETGDWTETHSIVTRLVSRLVGDPASNPVNGTTRPVEDPNLPPNTPKFYAGGGRIGLERDAFVQAGGARVLIRMFREKTFCGQEMAQSMDARDLSEEIVGTRLSQCWNEALAVLRELVYHIPSLVSEGFLDDHGDFLPFLFSLLSHDSCFDGSAALIEEILSCMSQAQSHEPTAPPPTPSVYQPRGRQWRATTFFLANVPNLYKLWRGFNCRQLAHFCRILALLVFEPEDRQLLESPAVLKSLELLQIRRNRAARTGRDSTVDMNQSILLGDPVLMERLLKLLSVMNYAPPLRRFSPYHVLAHFPFIADTLVMLGLVELENWSEIDRQDALARSLLTEMEDDEDDRDNMVLSDLGAVADMLDGLSETLMGENRQQTSQIGQLIHILSAAQDSGIIVGRDRGTRPRRRRGRPSPEEASPIREEDDAEAPLQFEGLAGGEPSNPAVAAAAGILFNRLSQMGSALTGGDEDGNERHGQSGDIIHPEDAANSLQFNAMLLGPYQVEVLFVLCTLLGGRRKIDAQDKLNHLGLIPILNDMFQRLPWHKTSGQDSESPDGGQNSNGVDQPNGIHGPGCECTPESALCVQYLRLLHNFCDRDCDNYSGRRLLLTDEEKKRIADEKFSPPSDTEPGLLSKIVTAFTLESDESPYRFWLASSIESYLRGSSPSEQMFVAKSGLLRHLVDDISSERLHCAGSLQTSFDLLGELSKGNTEVVRLIIIDLDEHSFRKLMSVAAANLVDSNVFIRSLLLSLERFTASLGPTPLYAPAADGDSSGWTSLYGRESRSYLTHSWWDIHTFDMLEDSNGDSVVDSQLRPSDWFPVREAIHLGKDDGDNDRIRLTAGHNDSVGHFGWVFSPAGDALASKTYLPNTLERLSWFLSSNQARLLRDLLMVVDLRNINHENICCLNTAVVIAIFAHRRRQLGHLLDQLRELNDEEKEAKRRALDAERENDVVGRAFIQAMRRMDVNQTNEAPAYARRASIEGIVAPQIGDHTDIMRNFREVLWFWMEYYTHRGRDRLSLEFSSHIRFQEWNHVVSLLAADDGSPTSLVYSPVRLPRSPYQRASRGAEGPLRGT